MKILKEPDLNLKTTYIHIYHIPIFYIQRYRENILINKTFKQYLIVWIKKEFIPLVTVRRKDVLT